MLVVFFEEDEVDSSFQDIKYLSFQQKDWSFTIKNKIIKISKDSTIVTLEGLDTGVHIDHYFALRLLKWHLFKIRNESD